MSAQSTGGTPSTSPAAPPPTTEHLSGPSRRRAGTIGVGIAIAIAIVLLVVGLGGGYLIGNSLKSSSTSKASITETGSSLLYPLMTRWAGNYTAATLTPASTGSGTGQSDAELGLVNIGGSDAYLANASATNLINVPVAISAQLVYYNLPGITANLNLNGTVIGMIYTGAITTWNDPLILAAQSASVRSQLNALSPNTIHPIKRSDSSGDTFLFTSYCDMSWSGWPYGASTSALTGDTVATGAQGNVGVVTALSTTTNSIGYVGISYMASATADHLTYAALGDNLSLSATGGVTASNYILPTTGPTGTISQDANLGLARLDYATYGLAVTLILGGSWAGAITLVKGGGGSNPSVASPTPYPIVNLEYTLIKTAPTGSTVTSTNLAATVAFLQWAISIGNWAPGSPPVPSAYINAVGFLPLTPEVAGYDMQQLALVST